MGLVRLCMNIELPDRDLRVGVANLSMRSLVGTEDRQLKRFFPLILMLEALVQTNEWQLARFQQDGHPLPGLYESGVRYQAEPEGQEEWLDYPSLLRQRWGDCEDIACARTAELRYVGIAAMPCIRVKVVHTPKGPVTLVHVLSLWPDGTIEDPSRVLGMQGEF